MSRTKTLLTFTNYVVTLRNNPNFLYCQPLIFQEGEAGRWKEDREKEKEWIKGGCNFISRRSQPR